jgi:uncharacterized protein DUF3761
MIRRFLPVSLILGVLTLAAPAFVTTVDAASKKTTAKKTTGEKPADATAECKDGSYSHAKTEKGACSKHGGVKTWYGEAATAAPATSPKTARTAKASTKAKTTATTPATSATTGAPRAPATAPKTSADAGTRLPEKPVAAAPAGAPEGATAKCKDGTYSQSKTHTGACSHHGGVAEWYK